MSVNISCTVKEFGQLVRDCEKIVKSANCPNCVLKTACNFRGIEMVVSEVEGVTPDEAD